MASLGRSANVSNMEAKRAGRRVSGKTVPAATRAAQSVCVCIEPPLLGIKVCCQRLLSYYLLSASWAVPTSSQKLWVMLSSHQKSTRAARAGTCWRTLVMAAGRQRMARHADVEALKRRGEVACHLGGGLGRCVRHAEGMQREREGLHGVARRVVRCVPARQLGVSGRH